MDEHAIIERLHRTAYLHAMAHVTTFQGERTDEDGDTIPVTVAILDYGPEAPETRYRVVAEDADGATVEADAAESIEAAIDAVPWTEFVPAEEYEEDEA